MLTSGKMKEKGVNTMSKGRHSIVVGIRISKAVNTILEKMAEKKGMTVSAFVKGKVEEYARLANEPVNTTKPEEYVLIGGVRYKKGGSNGR